MNKLILVISIALTCSAFAKDDPKYPVSSIAKELKENVNVIFRSDQTLFKILSKSKASLYVYKAITILNSNGSNYAKEVIGYDKLSKITSLRGNVYNAEGALVKKIKSSEIYDQSAYDGFSLYSDNRLKVINLSQGTYPYTVEIEYEIEFKYLFFIPPFFIVPDEKVSVEHSEYSLVYPKELKPRYETTNIDASPISKDLENNVGSLTWKFENIKPYKFEPIGPPKQELIPHILAAPSIFEYENYAGSLEDWNSFGKWILSLNNGRNTLPESTIKKIKALVAHANTTEEKVKVLYEFLQNNTRYVSIQLGIGGFQPFEASVVDKTGYGDCKALSNYMVSMLDVAGIKSNYVLVKAGKDAAPINAAFTSSQFNHVIVCVPNGADTLWLECTSQTNPFGYMGSFTGDRKALAITSTGAKVVSTPVYSSDNNMQSRNAKVTLDKNGNAKAIVKTINSGLQYENDHLNFILSDQYDEQKKWLNKNIQIPTFDINSFSISDIKNKIPSAEINLNLTLNRLATVNGKRLFLSPNLMNRSTFIPEKLEKRKTPVIQKLAYSDFDTITYLLPEELYPEFLPEPVSLKTRFGEYETTMRVDQGKLIYTRKIKMFKGEFPADSYNELVEFYKNINKADNAKIVFLNKT